MSSSDYVRLSPGMARMVLLVWALAIIGGMWVSFSSERIELFEGKLPPGRGDIAYYWDIVHRLRAGEGYYEAISHEIVRHGYPTNSVFNWRSPLPLVLLGSTPRPILWKVPLAAIVGTAITASFTATRRSWSFFESLACALLLAGALLHVVMSNQYVLPILWAQSSIALSISLYGLNRTSLAVAAGIAAGLLRDLAVMYGLLMMAWALWHRRWYEGSLWLAGLLVVGVYYAVHFARVAQVPAAEEATDIGQWLAMGGVPFALATAQFNAFLVKLPQWVTAIYLPCALLGFAAWKEEWGRRTFLVTAAYLTVFLFVGKPVNHYWGLLIAPLLCYGVARAPASLRDLWQRSTVS